MFFGTSILDLILEDFWRAVGPQNWWFSHFFRIFFHANFEAFFWTAKNAIFGHIFSILGPLGGSCGPGKLKLRAWLKRKSPSMLNPYVEGNVYPFVVYFFWLPFVKHLARRAPRWGRRRCCARTAALQGVTKGLKVMLAAVSCSNSCNSTLACKNTTKYMVLVYKTDV